MLQEQDTPLLLLTQRACFEHDDELQWLIFEHPSPEPVKPSLHVQEREPGPVMLQAASASHPPLEADAHTSIGSQDEPFPVKPLLQAQEAMPGPDLVQMASVWQPPFLVAHIFIASQSTPSPENPSLHEQLREFGPVNRHVA